MTMDAEDMIPIDIETYSFDIDQANKNNKPEWIRNFSDLEIYKLKDLSPKSYFDFAYKMYVDPEAALIFQNHMQLLPSSLSENQ